MTTDEAINHFGSKAEIARVLKIQPQALSQWGKRPPKTRQLQMAIHSDGKLKADKSALTG